MVSYSNMIQSKWSVDLLNYNNLAQAPLLFPFQFSLFLNHHSTPHHLLHHFIFTFQRSLLHTKILSPKHYFRDGCAIDDWDSTTVIITGGRGRTLNSTTVSVYGLQGWKQDLPPLNIGRFYHACTSFLSGGHRVSESDVCC